jgi:hypothetical protein
MREFARWVMLLLVAAVVPLSGCNGVNTPGRMEWVQPRTTGAPRVGTVYLIRGWQGVYSAGIDEMAKAINERGGTAYVFQDMQYLELSKTMIERYKNDPNHEPICFVGHSRGVDAEIIIARDLQQAGVIVDYIAALDSVDQDTVSANVRLCYNYWMPGPLPGNLLHGIPLKQEAGSTGQLFNLNLDTEYRAWRQDATDHISLDDDPWIQKRIVDHIMEICVERSKWTPPVQQPPFKHVPADPVPPRKR